MSAQDFGGRPPVLVTRRLQDAVLERIEARCAVSVHSGEGAMPRADLLAALAGARGVITLLTDEIDGEALDAAGPSLQIVANLAVGYGNIDVSACTEREVMVTNTPDVLTEATADFTWALLLAAARRLAEGDRFLRARKPWIWGPEFMLGAEVHGRTLGIVGLGRIGEAVARRASGFGMRVVYTKRRPAEPEVERRLGASFLPLEALLAEADFVVVLVPLTDETHHLFGTEQFSAMKPTAVFVNASRGPVVDEAALVAALEQGEILAAGLDVYEREPELHPRLPNLDNVVLAPHLGSATHETRLAMGMLAADNLLAGLAGERPPNLVNPDAWHARTW